MSFCNFEISNKSFLLAIFPDYRFNKILGTIKMINDIIFLFRNIEHFEHEFHLTIRVNIHPIISRTFGKRPCLV